MRLPSPISVVKKLQSSKLDNSIQYLIRNRSAISKYTNIEDFVLRDEEYTTKTEENPKTLKACEHHLLEVRRRLAKELWSRDFFLGVSVMDELLFSVFAHTNENNPILRALEIIRDSGVLHPGFVVYPLHALGVIAAGLLYPYTSSRLRFFVPQYGLIVTPQTNSLEETASFLENAATQLGIRRKVPIDLLAHWRRTRLLWLEKNPLLVLRVHSFPGEYYENQFFLVSKLKLATTLLFMLNSMQNTRPSREGFLMSTSRINNWETLDIRHYLVFYPKPYKKELRGDCIPMSSSRATLAELSEASCEMDPRFWRQRIPLSKRLAESLDTVGRGFLRYSIGRAKEGTRGRVYRKIFRSLEFYRKSHRQRDDLGEAAVNLAVAFEILLTDSYSQGISDRILERISSLLKGVEGVRRFKRSVSDLYDARSKYVHAGNVEDSIDINIARVAFVHTFLAIVSRLARIPNRGSEPMKQLIANQE
jgi:hypothetical protein